MWVFFSSSNIHLFIIFLSNWCNIAVSNWTSFYDRNVQIERQSALWKLTALQHSLTALAWHNIAFHFNPIWRNHLRGEPFSCRSLMCCLFWAISDQTHGQKKKKTLPPCLCASRTFVSGCVVESWWMSPDWIQERAEIWIRTLQYSTLSSAT